ncbi:ras-like GTP-binding protein rhoA [Symsagittifera roscoffensis]|uniref:ras-like GTP-binding protein rhoA n=1 Tax=Symsagittifera roscoffensis TaxID=84072 RepID=UPI00307B451E
MSDKVKTSTSPASSSTKRIRKSLVVVGDGMTGKSCLLQVYVNGDFYENYQPTVFENCCKDIEVNHTTVDMTIHDTAGQEEYSQLRPFSYHSADICVICFSVDNPDSLDNIEDQWMPEVRKFCPQARNILVALKKDLRYDPEVIKNLYKKGRKPLTQEEGVRVADRIGAYNYFECSAKYKDGVDQIFQAAAALSLEPKTIQKRSCPVM